MRPQIIREIRRPDGTPLRRFRPIRVRRVVSAPTAGEVTRMLVGCVENGTGKNAAVEGYWVAGKTGSAQRAVNGSYSGIVASFIGFLPAYDPRIAIAVVVEQPKGSHWGATTSAPVFQEIAARTMLYLRVPPERPVGEKTPSSPRISDRV